jgi:hypothetical protein
MSDSKFEKEKSVPLAIPKRRIILIILSIVGLLLSSILLLKGYSILVTAILFCLSIGSLCGELWSIYSKTIYIRGHLGIHAAVIQQQAYSQRARKYAAAGLLFILLLTVISLVRSPIRDELDWRWTLRNHSYEEYLGSWPSGRHADQAEILTDEGDWYLAKILSTVEDFQEYLQKHPGGKYVSDAQGGIEQLRWQMAERIDLVSSYQKYIDAYPSGRYIEEALKRRSAASARSLQEAAQMRDVIVFVLDSEFYSLDQ